MSSIFVAKKINDAADDPLQGSSTAIPVDVYRTEAKLILIAPIAGVTIEDVSVSITEDILTIKGNRHKPEAVPHGDYFSQECFWGEFSRSVVLPINVDTDKVAAFYKRGVLRIEMPVLEEEETRVIPVRIEKE